MRFSIICGMALRDYWHERALSLCAVLALATVLAPLLILFGVRNGVKIGRASCRERVSSPV